MFFIHSRVDECRVSSISTSAGMNYATITIHMQALSKYLFSVLVGIYLGQEFFDDRT